MWNQSAIGSLAQQRAAPGLRALRSQMRQVGAGSENPNVRRMSLRDALAGYGQGIGSIIGAASTAAAGEYGRQYAAESADRQTSFENRLAEGRLSNERLGYQTDLQKAGMLISAQSARDRAMLDFEKGKPASDYNMWLKQQEYGERTLEKRQAEADSRRLLDYSWNRWKRTADAAWSREQAKINKNERLWG